MINKKYKTLIFHIIYTLIFLIIFFKYPLKIKIICILIIFMFPLLFKGMIIIFLLIFGILTNNYNMYKILANFVFPNVQIDNSRQGIYISNYPSDVLEYLIPGLFTHKFCFVMAKHAKLIVGKILKDENVIYIDSKGSYDFLKSQIEKKLKEGYSIFVYPEKISKNSENIYTLEKFKSGIFNISKQLNVKIFPLIFNHLEYEFALIKNNNFQMESLKPISIKNDNDIDECFKNMNSSLKRIKFKNKSTMCK